MDLKKEIQGWGSIFDAINNEKKRKEEELQQRCCYSQYAAIRLISVENIENGMPVIICFEKDEPIIAKVVSITESGVWCSSGEKDVISGVPAYNEYIPNDDIKNQIFQFFVDIYDYDTKEVNPRMIDPKYWAYVIQEKKVNTITRYENNLISFSSKWERIDIALEDNDKIVPVVNILPNKNLQPVKEGFTNDFNEVSLFKFGLNLITDDGQYGVAESISPRGKRIVKFNRDGNYFGIYEDGGTRTVFNGIIEDISVLDLILEIVR